MSLLVIYCNAQQNPTGYHQSVHLDLSIRKEKGPCELTRRVDVNNNLGRQHPVPLEDPAEGIAGAEAAQAREGQVALLEARRDAERVDELGVGREVAVDGPALLVGRALAQGADHLPYFLLWVHPRADIAPKLDRMVKSRLVA